MQSIFHPTEEQRLVQDFFKAGVGIFVDVGANDPIVDSQSFHLEKLGWTGILVEPLPEYAERLRRERKAKVYEVACGGPDKHGHRIPLKVAGAFSSVTSELMVPEHKVEKIIEVKMVTLDSIFTDAGIKTIDLLSVDVEGYELEVLRGIDFNVFRPRLILLEDHVIGLEKHRFMLTKDYKLVRRTGLNSWYVPKNHDFPLDIFGRLQLFRKYILGTPIRRFRFFLRVRKAKKNF